MGPESPFHDLTVGIWRLRLNQAWAVDNAHCPTVSTGLAGFWADS